MRKRSKEQLKRMVAEEVRRARDLAALTQEELKNKSGVSQNYLSLIEQAGRLPSIEKLEAIAAACGRRLIITMEEAG